MIAEQQVQQSYSNSKYYQFYTVATILERVIDCFHTIVSDETNPYHPPLSWLTRKQLKPPKDELFHDLFEECSTLNITSQSGSRSVEYDYDNDDGSGGDTSLFGETVDHCLSSSVRSRLEKCSTQMRKDVVSRTKDGCSPFFIACKNGHYNIVKYLLDSCDIDIEQKGRYEALEDHHIHSVTPLWIAAVSGHLNIVKLLIDHNVNINSLSDTGSTPLRSVCFLCKDDDGSHPIENDQKSHEDVYFQIVKLLIENGADISKSNFNGGTCLINSIHNYKLTLYIIECGSDVNASDHQSKTALHYAIQQERLEVTKLLLSRGADPMLQTNFCDDALQLSCLVGHVEIFNHLTKSFDYSNKRLIDALKLLGSSILELHYDLTKVRELWQMALDLQSKEKYGDDSRSNETICDIDQSGPFGDIPEFSTEQELQSLSTDDFRIQSLLISERILGSRHRETIQRLLYRGTFYINSLRLDRCIELWIYALRLRLQHDSIFHFESIFASQAITKLFFDMLSQGQLVKFQDVHEVLSILIDQLSECKCHLSKRPVSCLHEDIFDLLLSIIVNLLFVLNYVSISEVDQKYSQQLTRKLVKINPRSSKGSSLLHVCITPGLFDGDAYRILNRHQTDGASPIVKLMNTLIDNGLEVDMINSEGLSALQVLCLASVRLSDKKTIIKRLVDSGAHVDRRSPSPEHQEVIRQSLKEAGVNPMQHMTLSCLAARKLSETKMKVDKRVLTKSLRQMIAIH